MNNSTPPQMNAVVLTEHGGVDKLKTCKINTPRPKAGEVLVRVRACALNHLDIWTRMGLPGVKIDLPHILGCDVSGEIAKLGPDVKECKIGARVSVLPGVSCGTCPACKEGWDSTCDQYKIIGFLRPGGYAEYVSVPARNVISVSNKYDFPAWASIPLVFLTAWHMLVTHGRLKREETVLIHGAGSGVGSAAIQIAKYFGAKVISTLSDDGKVEKAKKLGADHLINYQKTDLTKEVQRITNNRGVDLVIEHIGQAVWDKSLACLAKRGRLVTCGATTGGEVKITLRFLFMKQLQITGSYMGGRPEFLEIIKLVEAGHLKPVLDKTFPLREAAEAHQYLESRRHFGKVVLLP